MMNSGSLTVIKIGGSFLTSHESMYDIASLARERRGAVFVLSAFRGITDRLVSGYGLDAAGREAVLRDILAYHANLVQNALNKTASRSWSLEILYELGPEYYGIDRFTEFAGSADYDSFLSMGEKLAAAAVSIFLSNVGIRCRNVTSDRLGITVQEESGVPMIDVRRSHTKAFPVILKLLESGYVPITTGFFGIDDVGKIRILGRNSSDYSAIALGAALKTGEVLLLKDVPGIYSNDPKLLKSGEQHFSRMSYEKALELCSSGSKIIHPMALITARQHGIPIRIMKYGDSSDGTLVAAADPDRTAVPS
jgi:aspartate kinase